MMQRREGIALLKTDAKILAGDVAARGLVREPHRRMYKWRPSLQVLA